MHAEGNDAIAEFDEIAGFGEPVQVLHGLAAFRGQFRSVGRLGRDRFEKLENRDTGCRFDFFDKGTHTVAERDFGVERLRAGRTDKQLATAAFEDLESAAFKGSAEFLGHGKRARTGDIGGDTDQAEQVGLDGGSFDVAGHGGMADFLHGAIGVMGTEMGFHFGTGFQNHPGREFLRGRFLRLLFGRGFCGISGGFFISSGCRFFSGVGLRCGSFRIHGVSIRLCQFAGFVIFHGRCDFLGFKRLDRRRFFGLEGLLGRTRGGILEPNPFNGLAL